MLIKNLLCHYLHVFHIITLQIKVDLPLQHTSTQLKTPSTLFSMLIKQSARCQVENEDYEEWIV